jgi:hypothetical protein
VEIYNKKEDKQIKMNWKDNRTNIDSFTLHPALYQGSYTQGGDGMV